MISRNIETEEKQKKDNSTCVLIGLQVCFHSAMKHENDVSNMVGSVSKL